MDCATACHDPIRHNRTQHTHYNTSDLGFHWLWFITALDHQPPLPPNHPCHQITLPPATKSPLTTTLACHEESNRLHPASISVSALLHACVSSEYTAYACASLLQNQHHLPYEKVKSTRGSLHSIFHNEGNDVLVPTDFGGSGTRIIPPCGVWALWVLSILATQGGLRGVTNSQQGEQERAE